jgi:hypothetical protein
MRVSYKSPLKKNTYIFKLQVKSKPRNLSVDDELIALKSLLESAVQREQYDLAGLLKERMDLIMPIKDSNMKTYFVVESD